MFRSAIVLAAISILCLGAIPTYARAVDDFNPANGPAGGWDPFPEVSFPGLDNNKNVVFIRIKGALAHQNLLPTHVQTKVPTKLQHIHWQRDYTLAERDQADSYWNWFFDVDGNKATRQSNATNKTNCFTLALGSTGHGTYEYWIQGIEPLEPATKGFDDDTNPVDKTMATDGDLLYYKAQSHASILKTKTTSGSPPTAKYTLRWKTNGSGIYEATNLSQLDTPGRANPTFDPGQPPGGTWASNALGTEINLEPVGKVRRKK